MPNRRSRKRISKASDVDEARTFESPLPSPMKDLLDHFESPVAQAVDFPSSGAQSSSEALSHGESAPASHQSSPSIPPRQTISKSPRSVSRPVSPKSSTPERGRFFTHPAPIVISSCSSSSNEEGKSFFSSPPASPPLKAVGIYGGVSFFRFLYDEVRVPSGKSWSPPSALGDLVQLPLRVEGALGYGLLLCVDALLYDLTITPLCALLALLKRFLCMKPSMGEQVALVRVSILVTAFVIFHTYVDFSVLYHYLRAQSLLKLYFLYNMLEVLERLVRSWGSDLMDSLLVNLIEGGLSDGSGGRNFIGKWGIVVVYTCVHAHMHFWRVLLVSVALISADSSMFMIVITNNFTEIKGSVFKKYDMRSLYPVVSSDAVERLYLLVDIGVILFSLLTSPQKRRMPMSEIFFWIGAMMLIEIITDWIKFLCVAKFNQLSSTLFDDYHRLHQSDVIEVRCQEDNPQAFKGLLSYSHRASRRLNFQALPLSALLIFQLFSPALAGNSAAIWQYRLLAFACCIVLKMLLGVVLLGEALRNEQPLNERIATVKAL